MTMTRELCREAFEGSDKLFDACYKAVAKESLKLEQDYHEAFSYTAWGIRMAFHANKRVRKANGPFHGLGYVVYETNEDGTVNKESSWVGFEYGNAE